MSSVVRFFEEISKAEGDVEASWQGKIYKCKVDVGKDGNREACGKIIKCKGFVKHPLIDHMNAKHASLLSTPPAGQQSLITHALKRSEAAEVQTKNVVLAFADSCMERAFSVQSRIPTKVRSRLTEEACEAQLWLSLNYTKVMEPGKYDEQVEKNRTATKNKRDMLEKEFGAMIEAAKRRRRH